MAKTQSIDSILNSLDTAFLELTLSVKSVFDAFPSIASHVKWNSIAYYFTGEMAEFNPKEYKRDLVVFHLRKNHVLLVFPTGQRIGKEHSILEGDYTDGRRMITFKTIQELEEKKEELQAVIRHWIETVND